MALRGRIASISLILVVFVTLLVAAASNQAVSSSKKIGPRWDKNGYVFFCLCMGRFGNQVEHLLGGAAFAKALNRTLVVPPFITHRTVPFTDWFRLEPVQKYHKSIPSADFMKFLAPKYWPVGKRIGYCWLPPRSKAECKMKNGFPFKTFWDEVGVDFDGYMVYHLGSNPEDEYVKQEWMKRFPPSDHPVLAFRGAPATYPIQPQHIQLQRLLQWSDSIESIATKYINENLQPGKYVGIHLRNEDAWIQGCDHINGASSFMESPQCLGYSKYRKGMPDHKVSRDLCAPPKDIILKTVKEIVVKIDAQFLFIATDNNPMLDDFEKNLQLLNVTIRFLNPERPQIDLGILGKSDFFIGNCISSFTAFVKRQRDLSGLPSAFWAHHQ